MDAIIVSVLREILAEVKGLREGYKRQNETIVIQPPEYVSLQWDKIVAENS